jgi:hypothetical protein
MRQRRPSRPMVRFEGIAYEMDLCVVLVALVERQVEGDFHQRTQLAESAGCSRSTLSHFLAGRQVSLQIALALLEKLRLTFDEVYRRCDDTGPTE